jgi:transposase
MKNNNKYGLLQFRKEFATEKQCLSVIFEALHTYECSCGGRYNPLEGRRQYQCSKCRHQIAPTAGTIFHKSDTPLTIWFFAIFLFAHAKSGISAKQLQRDLGVTYKTAWRILTLIRKALPQDTDKLKGIVETDSAYFGGRRNAGENNKNLSQAIQAKSVVMGAVERGGRMRAKVVPDNTADTHFAFVRNNIDKSGTRLMTDSGASYKSAAFGYDRRAVDHHRKEYVRGDAHVNTMETFWAHAKRSIAGTHKIISKKYLQSYLDGFVFHYNNRHSDSERFSSLLDALLQPAK